MNPHAQEEEQFDQRADQTLRLLEQLLAGFDPDEVDVELAGDILTLTVNNREKIVINRHRAARQIWMAAARQAWHFDEEKGSGLWKTTKDNDELIETLSQVLSRFLGHKIRLAK